ncbi:hypothetical protein L6164_003708 [Bauhinia variegata]|uniref:Uncharacterized protein n=1 Tax=Bauhinia variegata TaxID=167791 RepID=A0ACB9Q258_BAUVA|nr:hypothetical protein L6164_003708 [Bauhinia variegata]
MKPIMEGKGRACVTGGTGFLGSWMNKTILEHCYFVNTTVRSDPECKRDLSFATNLPGASQKLQIFRAYLSNPDSFCAAIRVVYTSSAAAVSLNGRDDDVMDESFWSDVDFLRASKTHGWSYAISKTLTEKAVIEFGEQNRFKTEATKFKVVAECAGLPLAIVTISSALKGKDVAQWDHDVTGVQDAIIEEFSKSVERLEKTAESIFYHCGLIMGDNLARSNLFKHSVGIGLSEDIDKMEDVRDRVDACIRIPYLKVLDLTAVKFSHGLPSSIMHLEKLTTLCLDYCVLKRIAEDIGKLKYLKILSLSNSSIEELPRELGQLTQLQFLDLCCCLQLKVIPPNVFSSLKNLKELYMLDSFDDWDVNDPKKHQQSNASIFELMNLSCMTTLEVTIPNGKCCENQRIQTGSLEF